MRASAAVLNVLLLASLALASACAAPPARTIEVEMADLRFTPSSLLLRGGERVLLRFKNGGKTDHEFMAGRDPRSDGGYSDDLFHGLDVRMRSGAAQGHATSHGGFGLVVGAGQSGAVEFTVPNRPGAFEFGCFVVGHYEAGMKGILTVE